MAVALTSKPARGAAQRTSAVEKRNMIQWQTHEVAKIPEGYQVAVADVNGDGRLDILALSSEKSIVEWYENPTWKAASRHHGDRRVTSAWRRCFIPGYPARGMALASDFALDDSTHGGSLWWAEPDSGLGPRVAPPPARQDSHFPSAALGKPGRHGPPESGGRAAAGLWRRGAGLQGPRPTDLVRDAGDLPARTCLRRRKRRRSSGLPTASTSR